MAGTTELGRDAFARQAWAEAYTHLAAADPHEAGDLERLAVAAYLVGRDDESARAWESAHRACVASGDGEHAARCAFWLALGLLLRGDVAHARGWLARAERLVADRSVAGVFLQVPSVLEALGQGDAVLYGNCLEGMVDGMPQLRIAVFRPDQVTIEDTWTAHGLRGTGSNHFRVEDVVVLPDHTLAPLTDEPCIDEPIAHIPVPSLIALVIAAVALGNAQAALDGVVALASAKTPLLAPAPLAANPLFQHDLASATTALRAARALVDATAETVWEAGRRRAPFTLDQVADARAAGAWATACATRVVDTAYGSGGGTAVYGESALQRRLRDAHTVTQHFLVKDDTLTTAGAILAGQDPGVLLF